MKLVRNMRTTTVHRPDCASRGADTRPWHYAVTRTIDDLREDTCRIPWLHLCRTCMPGVCGCRKCGGA